MKICSKCHQEKDKEKFNWKIKNKTRQSACKICTRLEGKSHYTKNKQQVIQNTIYRNEKYRKVLTKWKETLFCSACREDDSSCLDFHHLDSTTKDDNIATLFGNGQIQKTISELNKCVVICSNCHRKHHAGRLDISTQHVVTSKMLFETLASVAQSG